MALFVIIFPTQRIARETPPPEVLGQVFLQLPLAGDTRPRLKKAAVPFVTDVEIALAVDLRTGYVLFEKNSQTRWPLASLTKLMTAVVVWNLVDPQAVITIPASGYQVHPPNMGLLAGEQIGVMGLLSGMLIASANDASLALAEGTAGSSQRFIALMNLMSKQLGLSNTHFANPTGFDDSLQYSTAEDLKLLTFEFLRNEKFAEMAQRRSSKVQSVDEKITHWLKNSNLLLQESNNILGVKTGFTEQARGNLIILASDSDNNQILTIVLGSEKREEDSKALIRWVFESYDFP
ncbi:MAG: D-alanyl-D-alanine carboxypeptidase [Candidatus Doudnabacteria bacterium]|nr:D-alanyl-D-alanine carboxypeptidase [Candidatus Doudnabacteria bacterium]